MRRVALGPANWSANIRCETNCKFNQSAKGEMIPNGKTSICTGCSVSGKMASRQLARWEEGLNKITQILKKSGEREVEYFQERGKTTENCSNRPLALPPWDGKRTVAKEPEPSFSRDTTKSFTICVFSRGPFRPGAVSPIWRGSCRSEEMRSEARRVGFDGMKKIKMYRICRTHTRG